MIDPNAFRLQLLKCFSGKVPSKLLVALSGGVDSMCLAYLLLQYKKIYDPKVEIHTMTIDHGYRQTSHAEASKVGTIMKKWGLHHHLHLLSYDKDICDISNFEEVARTLRYQAFQEKCHEHGIGALMVAHNLNDRLETYLQRLQMNSTIFGLGGLRPKVELPIRATIPNEAMVYRPLLQFEKCQIKDTCIKNDVIWFEDPTNADRNLTKRNLHRYMINEYIPDQVSRRPELLVLSKESLTKTIREIDSALEMLENRISALDHYILKWGDYKFNHEHAYLSFSIPIKVWNSLDNSVAARWLFQQICPLSSAKHLHWSYAKIERRAMPRIKEFINAKQKTLRFTYINIVFRLTTDDGILHFCLSKQPPEKNSTESTVRSVNVPSSWILVDRTWWVKINSAMTEKVRIGLYGLGQKKQLQKAFPLVVPGRMENLPIVMADDEIVSLPTLGLAKEGYSVDISYKK